MKLCAARAALDRPGATDGIGSGFMRWFLGAWHGAEHAQVHALGDDWHDADGVEVVRRGHVSLIR